MCFGLFIVQYDKEDYSRPYCVRNAGNTSRKMIGQVLLIRKRK